MTRPLAWQATLGGLVEAGARLRQRCAPCDTWEEIDPVEAFCLHGPDFSLWDYAEACDRCGGPTTFHASPGHGTPFLPLRSAP